MQFLFTKFAHNYFKEQRKFVIKGFFSLTKSGR